MFSGTGVAKVSGEKIKKEIKKSEMAILCLRNLIAPRLMRGLLLVLL